MEKKDCTKCNESKTLRQFSVGKDGYTRMDECKSCETFKCSGCSAHLCWNGFSFNQREKGDKRKCRSCTGQGTATLNCSECLKTLSLNLFRMENRSPPICNQCRQELVLEEMDSIQALTGEYVGHGRYDTLTGADDGSGV